MAHTFFTICEIVENVNRMRPSKLKIEVYLWITDKNSATDSDTIPSCKKGFPLLYYSQKGKSKIPLSSIPGSNIGAIKHGECTAGPKYGGGQQPLCLSHIREYRKRRSKVVRWRKWSRWRGSAPKYEEREVTRMLDTKISKK